MLNIYAIAPFFAFDEAIVGKPKDQEQHSQTQWVAISARVRAGLHHDVSARVLTLPKIFRIEVAA